MKIFQALLIFLIILPATCTVVTSINQCTCKQIQYQQDCLSVYIPSSNLSLATTCRWIPYVNVSEKQAKGVCLQGIIASISTTTVTLTVPTSTYCSSKSKINCPLTLGCALADGKTCTAFTGCSAYIFTTNSECQAISSLCTSDGIQCSNKQPCSYYTSQINKCGLYSSNSGSGTCKISGSTTSGATCVDQVCSDAPTSLTTDKACDTFLTGCVSTGVGCATSHVACSSKSGNASSCPTFIGLVPSEGLCKYSGTGLACAARNCADAPTTLVTNAQCIAYLPSCLYAIGQGCASSVQSCSQLTFSLGCSSLVNTSGVACTNNTSSNPATACREITCADNTTATTDAACNVNGLIGCVTNGAGCVASGSFTCSSYNGTNAQCATYKGSAGPCKGAAANATTSQACVVKTCADAPSTTNTNANCAAVQTGCVTTGYGCVSSLSSCSSYTTTATTLCDGYQGSDGPCTLLTGATQCSAKTCAGASTTTLSGVVTSTNTGCQSWFPFISALLPGCVTNGTACVAAGTCTTLSQTSCTGYSTCSFTKTCVQNNQCQQYSTQSQCISNVGQFSRSCTWNGTCAPTACPVPSASITNDRACQGSGATVTPECYYQGTGTTCVDGIGANCGLFTGDNTFVSNKGCAVLFNNQCASSAPAIVTAAACVARTCTNFYSILVGLTSTSQCNTWLSGCKSDNYLGCVTANAGCTSFYGTQTACNGITANSSQCFNTAAATASSQCVVKTAAMILSTATNQLWTDAQCAAALSPAVSSQVTIATNATTGVCVPMYNPCSSFSGTLGYCSAITQLTGGKCTKTANFCFPKIVPMCTTLVGTSITACQTLYFGCTWASGVTCVPLGACSTYTGVAASCNMLTDNNGLKCGSNQSSYSPCISANFCSDFNTGTSPTASITYCNSLTDALGNTCTAFSNTDTVCGYPRIGNRFLMGYNECVPGQVLSNGKCTTQGAFACTALFGVYFIAQANQVNCASVSSTCTWIQGGTGCIATSGCAGYTLAAAAADAIIGNAYCNQYRTTTANTGICYYVGKANPQDKTVCAEPDAACARYNLVITGQAELTAAMCSTYQNAAGKYCGVLADGSKCADPATCSAVTTMVNLVGAKLCQGTIDSTMFTPCSQATGAQTACQSGVATCAAYTPAQASAGDNATLCQGYFTSAGVRCGFMTGATTCSNRTCGDAGVTEGTCGTYLTGCVWTAGGLCVANTTINSCTQLKGNSLAACILLFDNKGRQCHWVTPAISCTDQQCSVLSTPTDATHAVCQLFNSACTAATPLSGNKCQTIQTSCFKYVVMAADIAACTQLVDSAGIPCSAPGAAPTVSGPCTYGITQPVVAITAANCNNPAWTYNSAGPTCTGTSTIVATCSGTTATGATFAAQLTYCQSLTSAVYGKPCFFTQYSVAGVVTTNCVDSVLAGPQNQLVYAPNCPAANVSNTPAGGVASAGTGSDADCAAYSSGCAATTTAALAGSNTATACTVLTCAMASSTVATSTAACQAYQTGCLWNGVTGCIVETASTCANVTGTVTSCATFALNKVPCYQSIATAITAATAAACSNVTCANAPTTITTNAGCEIWFPSTYSNFYDASTNPGPNLNCVWNGTVGCTVPQVCSAFVGNATTCKTFTATDGPCKAGPSQNCTPVICADAPNSYNTDSLCAKYANAAQSCLTTGYGCASRSQLTCTSIVNEQSCKMSIIGGINTTQCSWLPQCVASVTSCTDASLSNATLCITTPISGANCVWNPYTLSCQNMTCVFLPVTLQTHSQCSNALSGCTTTGAGCINQGSCASYTAAGEATCLAANNQEVIGQPQITKCIWTINACRVLSCTDNAIASTNNACNVNGLTQCVTTGLGCIQAGTSICSQFVKSFACLSDGEGNPCLWINGQCQKFNGCTSVPWSTYAQCSQIGCTTNGTNCIALNFCSNYTTAASCVVQNNYQICGWLPIGSNSSQKPQCIVFGACTDAVGITNADCQLYSSSCISNGVSCQKQASCDSYTKYACQNNFGTDGQCFWQTTATIPSCRTQQCADYTGLSPTDAICASFPAPVINSCTTNGTTCVKRATCSSYTDKDGCILGTDGTCFWVKNGSTGSCRVKMCTDAQFTTNGFCGNLAIVTQSTSNTTNTLSYLQCVSNGTICIPKSTCSSYTTQIACQGGGIDGSCAFTAQNQTGTCALMTSCSSANQDQLACDKAQDRCFYQNQTCSPLTCAQVGRSSTCKPIPSFNYSSYQVCGPVSSTNNTCIPLDASQLTAASCFNSTLSSYTWNDTSSSCNFCGPINQSTTVTNTTTDNQTSAGILITSFILYGAFLTNL